MKKALRFIWNIILAPFRFILRVIRAIFRPIFAIPRRIYYFFTLNPDDSPVGDAFSKAVSQPSGILPHIIHLRMLLLRTVIVLVIMTSLAFVNIHGIMTFLAEPLEGGISSLKAIEVTENVGIVMKVSLLMGLACAFPYIIYEIWYFAADGLMARTRRMTFLMIPFAIILFIGGMAFAYFIMLPAALLFLFNFMGLSTEARTASYFNFVISIMFWFGIACELPLLSYLLADFKIISAKTLASQWRLAIILIAVLAAAITPTVDPFNMALVMGPLVILYFLSIAMAYFARRSKT